MNWQLMETAPKDGTRVLLYLPNVKHAIHIGHWSHSVHMENGVATYDHAYWCVGYMSMGVDPKPSHWMPLPKEPNEGLVAA